jgi:uncharacterized delta-60 repeat protein
MRSDIAMTPFKEKRFARTETNRSRSLKRLHVLSELPTRIRLYQRLANLMQASLCTLVTLPSFAQVPLPGRIDSTFGDPNNGNYSITALGQSQGSGARVAITPDNKILIAATCRANPSDASRACVGRLNNDGSVDTSFASNGAAYLSLGACVSLTPTSIAIDADGGMLIASVCTNAVSTTSIRIHRLLPNGAADTQFWGAGATSATFFNRAPFSPQLIRQSSGKIAVATVCTGSALCIARFEPNGFPDTSFGGGQAVLLEGSINAFADLADQSDGKLLLASQCTVPVGFRACVKRVANDGTLDASFSGGNVILSTAGVSAAKAIIVQPDGKALVAAACVDANVSEFCNYRLNTNGAVDPTYAAGNGGAFRISTVRNDPTFASLQADGKMIVGGICKITNTAFDESLCLARLHQDGSLDRSFGEPLTDGRVFLPKPSVWPQIPRSAIDRDGRIVLTAICGLGTCAIRLGGGPFGAPRCTLDVDGDGFAASPTDSLLATRTAMGFTGSAVTQGASFAAHATRKTWPAIREFMETQCGMPLAP